MVEIYLSKLKEFFEAFQSHLILVPGDGTFGSMRFWLVLVKLLLTIGIFRAHGTCAGISS